MHQLIVFGSYITIPLLLATGSYALALGRDTKPGQWQEVEGLLFSPQNSQLVHILSFCSQGVVSLFIFPTGTIALDSEPRGRRYVKNTGHDRNCLYSRAIHCPASMVHILSFCSQAVVSLFIFPIGPTALDSEPRGTRYIKNLIYNRNHLYSRAIHCPASKEKHYVHWFLLKSVQDIMDCAKNQIFPSRVWTDQAMAPGFGVLAECPVF